MNNLLAMLKFQFMMVAFRFRDWLRPRREVLQEVMQTSEPALKICTKSTKRSGTTGRHSNSGRTGRRWRTY
jgi:hypothetical protein